MWRTPAKSAGHSRASVSTGVSAARTSRALWGPPWRAAAWTFAGRLSSTRSERSRLPRRVCAGSGSGSASAGSAERAEASDGSWAVERLFHDAGRLLDHPPNVARDLVGQEVGDPHEPAASRAVSKNLHRRVVVSEPASHHGPHEAPRLVVEVDDQLARHRAIAEGDDAGPLFEARVDDEARNEARVQRAHIANRRPHLLGTGLEQDFLPDRGHRYVSCFAGRRLAPRRGCRRWAPDGPIVPGRRRRRLGKNCGLADVVEASCRPDRSTTGERQARKSGGHRVGVSAWTHRRQRAAVEATESGFGGSVNSLSG